MSRNTSFAGIVAAVWMLVIVMVFTIVHRPEPESLYPACGPVAQVACQAGDVQVQCEPACTYSNSPWSTDAIWMVCLRSGWQMFYGDVPLAEQGDAVVPKPPYLPKGLTLGPWTAAEQLADDSSNNPLAAYPPPCPAPPPHIHP